jgi:hypothetical protein
MTDGIVGCDRARSRTSTRLAMSLWVRKKSAFCVKNFSGLGSHTISPEPARPLNPVLGE